MTIKSLTCREHGGIFKVQAKRGRPPVKCSADNVCTRFEGTGKSARALEPITQDERKRNSKAVRGSHLPNALTDVGERMRQEYMSKLSEPAPEAPNKAPESNANGRSGYGPTATKARQAKSLLEAQGWVVSGKGKGEQATLTASRGEETLFLTFRDGELMEQNYMLWNVDTPKANGTPGNSLSFDPDELTDREIVHVLSGMKVTWWNRIAQAEQTAIVSPTKIQIEHSFAGIDDESPADRVVKFIDHGGRGFMAFRLGALLKVG